MMKTIHLLRHAKSDWRDASLADIERPLNPRGIRTAKLMATKLVEAGCEFEAIFCSPAVRAQSTIVLISEQLPAKKLQWTIDQDLYTFDAADLFSWFQKMDKSITNVLIIGHNPAFTAFCNALSHSDINNIPTCGYVQLKATQPCAWSQLAQTPFSVTTFLKPKALGFR